MCSVKADVLKHYIASYKYAAVKQEMWEISHNVCTVLKENNLWDAYLMNFIDVVE
jgi:hypothetical protein